MVKSFTSAQLAAKNAPEGSDVFLHLMQITLEDPIQGTTILRMARATEDAIVSGDTYKAFPFTLGENTEDLTGEVREQTVGILDMTGTITQFIKENDIDGAEVVLHIAFWNGSTYTIAVTDVYEVVAHRPDNERITIQLGGRNYLEALFPGSPLDRHRCRHKYRGADGRCGYAANSDGTIRPSCDFSLNGANGCKAHENENRFGGFPSLPTRRSDAE